MAIYTKENKAHNDTILFLIPNIIQLNQVDVNLVNVTKQLELWEKYKDKPQISIKETKEINDKIKYFSLCICYLNFGIDTFYFKRATN